MRKIAMPASGAGPVSEVVAGRDFLLYQGPLGVLESHQAGSICVLLALEQEFEVSWGSNKKRASLALVSAGLRRRLDFYEKPALAVYFDPHHDVFGALQDVVRGQCSLQSGCSETLRNLMTAYCECPNGPERGKLRQGLVALASELWAPEVVSVRPRRLAPVLGQFAGANALDNLDRDMSQIAELAELSVSRCTHLLKAECGVGLRRIKQYYRFKLAVKALAQGASFTEAAHAAGFADSAHFSRAHKDTFGQAPTNLHSQGVRWSFVDEKALPDIAPDDRVAGTQHRHETTNTVK